jgi:ADP-ribose pyrophosphatase YjhB (NUDIX family)
MHRNKLLRLLEEYSPEDREEIDCKLRFLDFIKTYSDCFKRELEIGHFTGSSWLENCDGTKFLLTKHKKLGRWWKLGGHADGDSDILNVAMREAKEESGLKNIEPVFSGIFDIDYLISPVNNGVTAHYHYDVSFLLRASNENEKIQISDESEDLQWFDTLPTDEIAYGFGPNGEDINNFTLNRLFRKWKALRY